MEISESVINEIRNLSDGTGTLSYDLFLFFCRFKPNLCIEIIIQDPDKGTLLTWREDEVFGSGWHIPGGVIRYKETLEDRLKATAESELNANLLTYEYVETRELILDSVKERQHEVVMIYRCTIDSDTALDSKKMKWFKEMPVDIIEVHKGYGDYFEG